LFVVAVFVVVVVFSLEWNSI